MNLVAAFADSVRKQPRKTALFWGEREYSYTELWTQTLSVSDHLRQQFGVRPGDRVGLWLKNCPEFVPSFFGALHAGAVIVPINNFLKAEEVAYIVDDAGIEVLTTDASLGAALHALTAARPSLKVLDVAKIDLEGNRDWSGEGGSLTGSAFVRALGSEPRSKSDSMAAERDLAVIIYTSGTTGRPKGAMLSHGNLLHNVESCRLVLATVPGDRFAVMLPMFHSYMLTVGLLLPLLVGGSVVLVKSLHPVRNAMQEIFQRQTTVLPAIPQFYRSMVN